MTYERERVNRVCTDDEVIIKKSSLTIMIIAIIALVGIIGGLGWQNYQQQQEINNLNNANARTATVTQHSPQTYQQQ